MGQLMRNLRAGIQTRAYIEEGIPHLAQDGAAVVGALVAFQVDALLWARRARHVHCQQLEQVPSLHQMEMLVHVGMSSKI